MLIHLKAALLQDANDSSRIFPFLVRLQSDPEVMKHISNGVVRTPEQAMTKDPFVHSLQPWMHEARLSARLRFQLRSHRILMAIRFVRSPLPEPRIASGVTMSIKRERIKWRLIRCQVSRSSEGGHIHFF